MDNREYTQVTDRAKSQIAAAQPVPKPILEELENRIRACNERAIQTALGLARLSDAVFGPQPEKSETGEKQIYDDSAIGRINAAIRDLETTLTQIDAHAARCGKLA